jgi:hypothetical protein
MRDWKWSPAEKAAARRAFDLALGRALAAVVQEAKERVAQVREASELWELEGWLSERRRGIERKFDYRYSVLPWVFAGLLADGSLVEDDLRGLAPDKIEAIRLMTRF